MLRRVMIGLAAASTGCFIQDVGLEDKACPCVDGYRCELATNTCVPAPDQGDGVAVPYLFAEQNQVQQNPTTSFVEVPDVSLLAEGFVPGHKYLLVAVAQIGSNAAVGTRTVVVQARLVHGNTEVPGSFAALVSQDATVWYDYNHWTVWTAVAGEGISMQFSSSPLAGGTTYLTRASLLAVDLSESLVEGQDWVFGERIANDPLDQTWTDGAAINLTAVSANDPWLVLSLAQRGGTSGTGDHGSRVSLDGGASVSPTARVATGNAVCTYPVATARVFDLAAGAHTLTEQSNHGGGWATDLDRLYSGLLALRLGRFHNAASAYTEAATTLGATPFATSMQTLSVAPGAGGPVWALGYFGFRKNGDSRPAYLQRMQIDGVDEPQGQTSDGLKYLTSHGWPVSGGNSSFDEVPTILSTVRVLDGNVHQVTLDASTDDDASAPSGQQRTLVAIPLALAE